MVPLLPAAPAAGTTPAAPTVSPAAARHKANLRSIILRVISSDRRTHHRGFDHDPMTRRAPWVAGRERQRVMAHIISHNPEGVGKDDEGGRPCCWLTRRRSVDLVGAGADRRFQENLITWGQLVDVGEG